MPSATRAAHRRPHPLPAAAGSASLCLLALLSAAPRAAAAGTWSVAPAGGGRPSLYAEGPPGAVLQDKVSVTNPGRTPLVVRLSGTGVPIAFAANTLRVPARTRADVPFTVTVPTGSVSGDRSGAVVARADGGRTETVALRLRVAAPALAALTVEHLSVHTDRIGYELVNRGTTVLVPRLAVRADGVLGRVLDRAPRDLPVRLPPGARLKLTEPWPNRPALDAVDVRVTVTAAGGAHDTATTTARFVPWPVPAAAAGTLAAGTAAAIAVRRRRSRGPDDGRAADEDATSGGGPAAGGSEVPGDSPAAGWGTVLGGGPVSVVPGEGPAPGQSGASGGSPASGQSGASGEGSAAGGSEVPGDNPAAGRSTVLGGGPVSVVPGEGPAPGQSGASGGSPASGQSGASGEGPAAGGSGASGGAPAVRRGVAVDAGPAVGGESARGGVGRAPAAGAEWAGEPVR